MLGSAIAMVRNGHMRMTALVNTTEGATRAALEYAAIVVPILLLGHVIGLGSEFAYEKIVITTPGLGTSNAWRASMADLTSAA